MNTFSEAMREAAASDAGTIGRDFADLHGASVARRVRTRRVVRAAGTGAVATAAVGAIGFGGWRWASDSTPSTGDADARAAWCLPEDDAVDLPLMAAQDDRVFSSFSGAFGARDEGSFSVRVREDSLAINLTPGGEVVLDIEERQLVGPDGPTSDPITLTFADGTEATIQMVWTDEVREIGFGLGDEMTIGSSVGFPSVGPEDAPGEWEPEMMQIPFEDEAAGTGGVILIDRGREQAQFSLHGDGTATVSFRDGTATRFALDDDGLVTVDWAGYEVISMDPEGGLQGVTGGADVSTPVDATISGPVLCRPLELGGLDGQEMQYVDLVESTPQP